MSSALWERQQPREDTAAPGGSRFRRLAWAAVAAVVLLAAAAMTWSGPGPVNHDALDPRNPTHNGAQALARVLGEHGGEVTVARGEQELRRSGIDANTTVVVTRTTELAQATTRNLAQASRQAQRLVVVNPDSRVVRYLSPEVTIRQQRRSVPALVSSCDGPDVRRGERLSRSQSEFQSSGAATELVGCFTTDGYSVYLALPATSAHPPLVLLGSTSVVTNEQITNEDNAAVVLRTLGHGGHLVWYVPDQRDIPATDASRGDRVVPQWLGPSLLLILFTLFAVFLWRGRRLGRLVTEPLPVVIRAIETTESRGRMYRRAKDARRAGAVLQDSTRRRLAGYLGLPTSAHPRVIADAVAAATGRPAGEVDHLLSGAAPAGDTEMLGLAAQLAALEKEVRRP